MSYPAVTTPAMPLDFKSRLILVKGEIENRIRETPQDQRNHLRARLWVKWINKNILSDKEVQA